MRVSSRTLATDRDWLFGLSVVVVGGSQVQVRFTFTSTFSIGPSPSAFRKSLSSSVAISTSHPILLVCPPLVLCVTPTLCHADPRCNLSPPADSTTPALPCPPPLLRSTTCSRAATPTTSDHAEPRQYRIPQPARHNTATRGLDETRKDNPLGVKSAQ